MIYTVTFNPSLDYMVEVDNFEVGKVNRTTKEYMLQGDGSLLAITSKTHSSDKKTVTDCKTASLVGGEFDKYSETYWDLSGAYPVFK